MLDYIFDGHAWFAVAVGTMLALFLTRGPTFFTELSRPLLDSKPRAVFVTGGGSGIGKAIVTKLLTEGDSVIACDIDKTALVRLEKQLNPTCENRLLIIQADVTDPSSLERAKEVVSKWLQKKHTKLHTIVNCAGLIFGGPLVEMEDKKFSARLWT